MIQPETTIIAFAGPSGSGKTELVKGLLTLYPEKFVRWQQVTTRPQREGDSPSDYVFLTKDTYDSVAHVLTCRTYFNGNYYGTFPEPVAPGVSVLTIVDAGGLASLEADVMQQNVAGSGKFGESVRVNLVRVLMTYEPTEERVTERGRASRGVEFVREELRKLPQRYSSGSRSYWNHVCDTTEGFPDAAEFFAHCVSQDTERLHRRIEALLDALRTEQRTIQCPLTLERLIFQLTHWESLPGAWSQPITGTSAAALVESSTPATLADDVSQGELLYSQGVALAEQEENCDNSASSDAVASDIVAPPVVDSDVGKVTENVEAIQAASSPSEIFLSGSDFEAFVLESGLGARAFETVESFRLAFTQYLSANGGDPNGVIASSQQTKDKKGGRIVEYVAILPSGEEFAAEYNERLMRLTSYGPR